MTTQLMTHHDFYALSDEDRETWTKRVHEAGFKLDEVVEFEHDSQRVLWALCFLLDEQGEKRVSGDRVLTGWREAK